MVHAETQYLASVSTRIAIQSGKVMHEETQYLASTYTRTPESEGAQEMRNSGNSQSGGTKTIHVYSLQFTVNCYAQSSLIQLTR
jgi:hypothetical protein